MAEIESLAGMLLARLLAPPLVNGLERVEVEVGLLLLKRAAVRLVVSGLLIDRASVARSPRAECAWALDRLLDGLA